MSEKVELIVSEILNNPFNYNAYKRLAQYYISVNKLHEGNAILDLISKNERPDNSNSDEKQ